MKDTTSLLLCLFLLQLGFFFFLPIYFFYITLCYFQNRRKLVIIATLINSLFSLFLPLQLPTPIHLLNLFWAAMIAYIVLRQLEWIFVGEMNIIERKNMLQQHGSLLYSQIPFTEFALHFMTFRRQNQCIQLKKDKDNQNNNNQLSQGLQPGVLGIILFMVPKILLIDFLHHFILLPTSAGYLLSPPSQPLRWWYNWVLGIFLWANFSLAMEGLNVLQIVMKRLFVRQGTHLNSLTREDGVWKPLFHYPYLATNPIEFWSRRWHPLYKYLWYCLCYIPLKRYAASKQSGKGNEPPSPSLRLLGMLLVFALSGLVHEYVTVVLSHELTGENLAFFLIQGLVAVGYLLLQPVDQCRVKDGASSPWIGSKWIRVVMNTMSLSIPASLFFDPFIRYNLHHISILPCSILFYSEV